MSAALRTSPKIRNSPRLWAAAIAAALLLHAAFILLFKPGYLEFLRSDLPRETEGPPRFPYIDNPFRVIPLAPELSPSREKAAKSATEQETSTEPPESFSIGEPVLEVLPMQGGGGGAADAARTGSRGATVQPKPLYIPWPKYPKGVKEIPRGSVELMVLVNEKGEVEDVVVTRSLPAQELNRIAVEAARQIRFIPGMERGARTSMWVRLAIGFQPR